MASTSTTDATDYQQKVHYLHGLMGTKVVEYLNHLRLGKYCEDLKHDLIDVSWGIEILDKYNTDDIALDAATNNDFTLAEMECLMEIVYLKLL